MVTNLNTRIKTNGRERTEAATERGSGGDSPRIEKKDYKKQFQVRDYRGGGRERGTGRDYENMSRIQGTRRGTK